MQSQKHYGMHRTPHPFERSRHLPQPLPHVVVHRHQVFFPQAAQQQQQQQQQQLLQKNRFTPPLKLGNGSNWAL